MSNSKPWQGRPLAKIDLARRAEIGRAKREKTRRQLMKAARVLYSTRAIESVIVDDVVRQAGVAKGTFYIHFENIEALQMAVADELAQSFVELLEPRRSRLNNPIELIADGCFTFIDQAVQNPFWGGLVARYAWAFPTVGRAARDLLAEDLHRATVKRHVAAISPELGSALVVGIVLQVMRAASERRLHGSDVPAAVVGILSALGVSRRVATAAVKRVAMAAEGSKAAK
jgi:AcrR family transcriptional regulator